jgi:hypothetical protein
MDKSLVRLEGEIEARICARYAVLQEQKGETATAKASTLLDRMLLPRVKERLPIDSNYMKLVLEK